MLHYTPFLVLFCDKTCAKMIQPWTDYAPLANEKMKNILEIFIAPSKIFVETFYPEIVGNLWKYFLESLEMPEGIIEIAGYAFFSSGIAG